MVKTNRCNFTQLKVRWHWLVPVVTSLITSINNNNNIVYKTIFMVLLSWLRAILRVHSVHY